MPYVVAALTMNEQTATFTLSIPVRTTCMHHVQTWDIRYVSNGVPVIWKFTWTLKNIKKKLCEAIVNGVLTSYSVEVTHEALKEIQYCGICTNGSNHGEVKVYMMKGKTVCLQIWRGCWATRLEGCGGLHQVHKREGGVNWWCQVFWPGHQSEEINIKLQ